MGFDILTLLILLPLTGAGFILLFVHGEEAGMRAKNVGMLTAVVTFAVSLMLYQHFDAAKPGYQFEVFHAWVSGKGISYHLGVDGISLFLILLTTLLTPICLLASWESVEQRLKEFVISFLLLEALVIGVFCALDLVLFYLFFESMLIPMYLIIGIWGGENRFYAAFKFFLYTLLGSVLFLVAILYVYAEFKTTDMVALTQDMPGLPLEVQKWLWLAFFASFAVKVPMWPVHTWLPDAHVQAPTAGSVILAGILLKMGGYGFIRLSMPMLPDASYYFTDFVWGLSIIAIIYTSFVALMQKDMKKLIAYSSVAHMGYVTLGLFAFTAQGVEGAMIQMLSHGLVSGALFLCVGVLYDRMHTKEIAKYGGLTERMPVFAAIFMLFTMASVGLPATSGFVGEFLALLGVYQASTWAGLLATTGVVLGAAYMLWLYKRVMFGEITNQELLSIADVGKREIICFLPLVLLVMLMGIYPKPFLDVLHLPVEDLLKHITAHAGGKA